MRRVIKTLGISLFIIVTFMTIFACAPPTTTGITVSGMKIEFEWGEDFSLGDGIVKETYSDGSTKNIDTGYEIDSTAFNSQAPGQYNIVVSYNGNQSSYTVTVKPSPVTAVTVSGAKTQFAWGEEFVFDGEVKATLTDDSERTIASGYVIDSSAYNKNQAGTYEIILSYKDKQVAYSVTVGKPPVIELVLSKIRTEYEWGEDFVFDATVKEKYANGIVYTASEESYVVNSDAYNSQVAGTYTIFVMNKDNLEIVQSYEVTVGEAPVSQIRIDSYKQTYTVFEDFAVQDVSGVFIKKDGNEIPITADNVTLDLGNYKELTRGDFEIEIKHKENESVSASIGITVTKPTRVRILFVGNSFSDDTSQYIPNIIKNLGYTSFDIGNLYYGGCSIDSHYSFATNGVATYDFRLYQSQNGYWNNNYGGAKQTLDYAVGFESWDVISFQQASGSSGDTNTYGNLDRLVNYVKAKSINPKVKTVFNMTWAYQQDSTHAEFSKYGKNQMQMYNSIVRAVKNNVDFAVVPNGTAIQNARTSFLGDTLTRDGFHLTTDVGSYIAGLTFVGKVLNEDMKNVTFAPAGLGEGYYDVAIESANNALAKPFEITQSKITSVEELILDGLVEMEYDEYGWTEAGGYWDSTASLSRYEATSGFTAQFVSTKRFTKEELPVGSVIKIESGWQYRPEAWVNNALQPSASRPNNVTTTYIKVTEQWWGNYVYRAFNVSKVGLVDFGADPSDPKFEWAKSMFTIYLPQSK